MTGHFFLCLPKAHLVFKPSKWRHTGLQGAQAILCLSTTTATAGAAPKKCIVFGAHGWSLLTPQSLLCRCHINSLVYGPVQDKYVRCGATAEDYEMKMRMHWNISGIDLVIRQPHRFSRQRLQGKSIDIAVAGKQHPNANKCTDTC